MHQKFLLIMIFSMISFFTCANTITVNNSELEYEVKGDGEHVVLFEAGAISGMAGWDSIWSNLPENVKAIRYSRRGEGHSSSCSGNLTAIDYAKDAEELVRTLQIKAPIISVSHSYGSKVARTFTVRNPNKVTAMLFVDPINPRDVDIIELLDPTSGKESNIKLKETDMKMGKDNGWCLINDIWDKTPSPSFGDIKNIPITLIAGVKKHKNPEHLFDTNEARELWGKYQSEWVLKFPRGKAVMAHKSGHFVQDDEPELVLTELKKLLIRVTEN
jgi:pimeloyl-ACP methyl ester carboxylesterase